MLTSTVYAIFTFSYLLAWAFNKGITIKRKNLLLWEQIFLLKLDPC